MTHIWYLLGFFLPKTLFSMIILNVIDRVTLFLLIIPAKTNCLSTTCNYNGVCTDLVDSFECHCNLGYSGTGCEQMATACSSGMCLNGGSCHSNGSSLSCSCATGYTGNGDGGTILNRKSVNIRLQSQAEMIGTCDTKHTF